MKSAANQIQQLFIVGPTASGKTSLAISLAKNFNGEIIAADSRTIYKGLDIGTAKPTIEERQSVKHWGFDLVGPGESFSAAMFQKYAKEKIKEIAGRGKLPIIVGGSGLYIDALIYDYSFIPAELELRKHLQQLTIPQLQQMIIDKRLIMPENNQNKRYLIRAIEKNGKTASAKNIEDNVLIIGLKPNKELLKKNITKRANEMIIQGVIPEIEWAYANYEIDSEALKGGIYKIFKNFILKNMNQDEALKLFVQSDLKLAKKQITWFKRNKNITWFNDIDSALRYAKSKLNNI
jgi:tRNA dimethylallyltransferase